MSDMIQNGDAEETWRLYFFRENYKVYYEEIDSSIGRAHSILNET